MRWSIEVFFKSAKSLLKLGSEFQGRNYDMLIAHTTIVLARYILLEWERRNNRDSRSYDEIQDIDYKTAIRNCCFSLTSCLEVCQRIYPQLFYVKFGTGLLVSQHILGL